jgi:hypothetical protein
MKRSVTSLFFFSYSSMYPSIVWYFIHDKKRSHYPDRHSSLHRRMRPGAMLLMLTSKKGKWVWSLEEAFFYLKNDHTSPNSSLRCSLAPALPRDRGADRWPWTDSQRGTQRLIGGAPPVNMQVTDYTERHYDFACLHWHRVVFLRWTLVTASSPCPSFR